MASYRAAIEAGIPPGPTTLGAAWYNRAGAEADREFAPLKGGARWAGILASIPPPAASATTPR